MENSLIVFVNHLGRSKLINVGHEASYDDILSQISGTWDDLNSCNFECFFTVGSFDNCVLGCDDDLKNMITLCKITAQSIVVVNVKTLSSQNPSSLNQSTQNQFIQKDRPYSVSSTLFKKSNDLGKENTPPLLWTDPNNNRMGEEQLVSVKKKSQISTLNQVEFSGDQSIPSYDVCPLEKKKSFLSDEWADIMKGGIGIEFGGAEEFRKELIKYMLVLGHKFKYVRNDSRYIHATCIHEDCDWFIKSKRRLSNSSFVVCDAKLDHKCVGSLVIEKKNRLGTSIISDLIMQKVKSNPTISGSKIIKDIKDDYGIDIPYWKAWRGIEASRSVIFGGYHESYDHLRWYCDAIKRTNPDSVVDLQKNRSTNRFERLFISFKACTDGFRFCRPMLFIDGTFMKGRSKGTMLSATAKDGDNGLFPVAFAIVSAETKDNWKWFLCKLRDHIKHDKQIMYISDRHKGLMSSFQIVFDRPVHFYCMYHLLANMKSRFTGGWTTTNREELADLFKECAYAPTKEIFDEKVAAFIQYGGKIASKWISELPKEKWAVSYSPEYRRYGEMTSNAAESFNSWISEARGLPITFMIDSIRKGLCRWFVERRQASNLWTGALCASKEALWNSLTEIGKSWNVVECPNGKFEVSSRVSVLVDLNQRSCSCYQWQIRGFPCAHAVAVILKFCSSVYSHVEDCYLTTNYRQCYMIDLNPIPETERFHNKELNNEDRILPPILKSKPGRPKKQRIAGFSEFRKTKPTFCTICGKTGKHDQLTCLNGGNNNVSN